MYISERPLGPREFTTVYVLMAEFQPWSSGERIKKRKGKKMKREGEANGRSLNVAATNRISRVVDNRRRLNVTPTLRVFHYVKLRYPFPRGETPGFRKVLLSINEHRSRERTSSALQR